MNIYLAFFITKLFDIIFKLKGDVEMAHMFDNYPSTTLPDNRYKFLSVEKEYKDVIIRGGEVEHCFKIPHNMNDISECEVIFYQGIEKKLIIPDYRISLKNSYVGAEEDLENC